MMEQLLHIFRIRRDERRIAWAALLFFVLLNALTVIRYYDVFSPIQEHYWNLFVGRFRVSGFDPITYYVVSEWEARYNVYRHPLLAFMMYLPYAVNQGLMFLTGINCAQFVVAALTVTASFYAFLFLYRIFRELMELPKADSVVLTAFLFSFAFVMLATMVPDHFVLSLSARLLTLYVSGRLMKQGRPMKVWHTLVLFILTAGISLNNGVKVFLSALFTNGRSFWRPRFLFLAVALPALLMWGFSRFEYRAFVWQNEQARHAAKARKKAEQRRREIAMAEAAKLKGPDPAKQTTAKPAPKKRRIWQGAPISNGEFMRWTDITTDRWASAVENLFGESIQLHSDYLLQDVLRSRPIIVRYRHWWNYGVEAVIVVLFLCGIWSGRRSRLLWMSVSFFLMDMALHMGLGFGINEVYIMAPHWIYVVPIAIGFLLKRFRGRALAVLRGLLVLLTVYLLTYNGWLITTYMLG